MEKKKIALSCAAHPQKWSDNSPRSGKRGRCFWPTASSKYLQPKCGELLSFHNESNTVQKHETFSNSKIMFCRTTVQKTCIEGDLPCLTRAIEETERYVVSSLINVVRRVGQRFQAKPANFVILRSILVGRQCCSKEETIIFRSPAPSSSPATLGTLASKMTTTPTVVTTIAAYK